jgi:hypothetical protein
MDSAGDLSLGILMQARLLWVPLTIAQLASTETRPGLRRGDHEGRPPWAAHACAYDFSSQDHGKNSIQESERGPTKVDSATDPA